jgi:sterol 14-demethylase
MTNEYSTHVSFLSIILVALDHSFVPILFFFPWIPNPHRTKCLNARNLFTKIFQEVIDERTAKNKADPNYKPPKDFLQVLMEAKYRDGAELTTTEITGIMIGVLLGGQHTSNVTGTWLMALLLKDEKWLANVMDEQHKLFEKKKDTSLHPSTLTYEDAPDMPIFDQVLSETLRMHPPFFQLSRSVKVDSKFQGKTIPKGHIVNISPGAAHRLPTLWDEPDAFDPSRFTAEKKKEFKPYAWIPFGGGMHQCGGRKFAWNSLKVSLTWLLRNYELEFVGKGATEFPKEDYTTMVVAPSTSHCRVKYRRRKTPVA